MAFVIPHEVGDVIVQQTIAGTTRRVRVTAIVEDVKNGRPGFDGVDLDTGETVWGYENQVLWVETHTNVTPSGDTTERPSL